MNKQHEEVFYQRRCMMTSENVKRCSPSPVIREVKIKIVMRSHYIPIRTIKLKKQSAKCWKGCRESRSLIHCWWEFKMLTATLENNLAVSLNRAKSNKTKQNKNKTIPKHRFIVKLSDYTPGHLLQKNETCPHKTCTRSFIAALLFLF